MASRLQTDDTKAGQANWADIDDDDDDWAPETITWQDGTQIAIPHTEEEAPAPEPEPTPTPAPAPAPATVYAPRLATKENGIVEKPKPAPVAASPIIKPGVLASGKGLILKGATEKPTLVAKPPAPPTPVKSPWASIPRVDKASPVIPDVPSHGLAKYPTRDSPIAKSNTPPPPKEIAADDFSRSAWRDGSSGAGRELYNSQSGRYEPVSDRRGSLRPEPQHGRQPALLQRSSHDQQGPIDQGRPGEQPYNRRRGSSNVSGGSGSVMHRLKTHDQPLPPAELINRRGSMTGRSDSPASPRTYSPGSRHSQAWPPRASPAMSHATPFQQHAQPVVPAAQQQVPAVTEDELELQKRVMRERRELAMKRRLEEEAREEAERKERIRLKLEALGPAPESNSAKKAAAKDHPVVTPTQIQSRETLPTLPAASVDEAKPSENAPSPSVASEVGKSDSTNGILAQPLPSLDPVEVQPQPHGSTHAHPWPNPPKPQERYPAATWGVQPATAKNVWGAPNNNRSLGNGTFNADLVTTQVPQIPSKAGPGPIAPPTSARPAQVIAATDSNARQPPIGPPKQVSGRRLDVEERVAKQSAWAAGVHINDAAFNQMLNDDFDKRDAQLRKEGRSLNDIQPVIKDTWRPTKIDDMGYRNETAPKQSIQLGSESKWAIGSEAKPASSQKAPSVDSLRTQGSAPGRDSATASILGTNNAAPQPTRGSRFFPAHRDRQDMGSEVAQRPKSPSPPPPDMAGHPAFDGDADHPHVSLPRPAVVVRLPPSIPTEPRAASANIPQGPASMTQGPSFAWASQAAYREDMSPINAPGPSPSAAPGNWQEKFNSLFSGRRSHPAPRSPVIESSSHNVHLLPTLTSARDGSITTKVRDEECFEEQEMGSLPPVRLPSEVPEMAWQPSPPPRPLPRRLQATVASAESISFPVDVSGNGTVWRIAIPGHNPTIVTLPFGRSRSNPRRGGGQGQRGGRQPPTAPHHRGGKGRDTSSTYSNDQGPGVSSSNSTPNRNTRGAFRGGREGWSRPTQAIQT